ncbi:plasmid mobilization protein (plasmid) [Escherichia coli]
MKRERMLTIRVTDDEHARLLERCEGKQLAVWMRRVCLGEPVARSGKLPTLAPPLLRQLAAIGNNLNQTARKVNWYLGGRIQANLEEIRKQEETLQKLNAKTWGVEFVQDGNRKFLVLPYGKSAEVIPFQGKEWVHLKE